ncbi:hypothetical protein H072_4599 [Dactylellina haptotyla CBS 200.50]|uniref:Ribosomal protein L9 domain-containing protein n=1 Tax=Dactylellina haptotyla (strain CBS 200.50) TaxID=1284197 RepID=S8AEK2_DACHA|nr:hypothetical protein H072_4599 [Dactylellina haptotyla CBS 200.50]
MSPPLPLFSAAVSSRGTALFASSLSAAVRSRPTAGLNLSICGDCLRSLGQTTFVRGKKKLPKAIGIKVRLLKDIPKYGPKGAILMVAPGRMRTIWYQRGEAEYLTRELEKSIGKYTLVERDPGFMPFVPEAKVQAKQLDGWGEYHLQGEVEQTVLPAAENLAILSSVLPPSIRFYRATITPTSDALHGSVTTADVASAIKMIAGASQHPDGNRVVVIAENVGFTHDGGANGRVKELGEYEVVISYKGEEETVKRSIAIMREEDNVVESVITSDVPPVVQQEMPAQTGSIFGGSRKEEVFGGAGVTRSNMFQRGGQKL